MATYTNAQLLELAREAIAEILRTGQSVSKEGRTLTMADLSALRDLEKEYAAEVAAEAATKAGRNRIIYVNPE